MKKVLLIIIGILFTSAAAAAVYIAMIDWNEHKDKIAQQFSEVTGKEIVFGGPVTFKILPSPYLTATDIKIYNPGKTKERPLVEIKKLVANLSLGPLLSGDLDIKRMVLENPQINVEVMDDNSLNWQYPLTSEQRSRLESTEITLNSVSLEKATLNFEDPARGIELKLDNLNGEIIAQSIMGPYRIEGNYIKDNNPEGFAISVGQLSNSFATTLNLVFTHPVSQSYVRFDGSFQLNNQVLNGNMILESENLIKFARTNFGIDNFQSEYNYPTALTFDVAATPEALNISNIVAKYGETQGAGNMRIAMNDGWDTPPGGIRPRVDLAFNFTDLNLDPAIFAIKEFIGKYRSEEQDYQPSLPVDLMADIKSVRTVYKNQPIKDFEASFDVINNLLTVNKLSAVLPGETELTVKGDLAAYDNQPFYNMDTAFNSSDLLKTLNWLEVNPPVSTASTYRKAAGTAKLSGNFRRIHVSPFALTADKSTLSGEAGIKLDGRPDVMLIVNADMVNFDNYVSQMPEEERQKSWAERMAYRFSRLGFLKDFDMQLTARVDLAIYENMPFEKIDLKANLLDGNLALEGLKINSVANAEVSLAGQISGFGGVPAYQDLQYEIRTGDVSALINKFELDVPNLDYKTMKNFNSKGVAGGDLEKFALNSVSKLENLELNYAGQVTKEDEGFVYNGNLEVKHPDFVKMLNDFNISYDPQVYSLGLFDLKTNFTGTRRQFRANPLECNIGFNNFQGELSFEYAGERPNITTVMTVNKLEIEKFLEKPKAETVASSQPLIRPEEESINAFLRKPQLAPGLIDYDFYKKFDLSGKFNIQNFSYKDQSLRDASFNAVLNGGVLSVNGLEGRYKDGSLSGDVSFNMLDNPSLTAEASLNDADFGAFGFGGSKYGISRGRLTAKMTLNTSAASNETMFNAMDGSLDFTIDNATIRGWNLAAIYNDLLQRESSEGLQSVVKGNLESGMTDVKQIKGKLGINKGGFSFADTTIAGNGVEAGVFGDGSLDTWEMNVLFNVKYDEPKYLPGFSFSLKGAMNNPLLDVDISGLFDLYKMREEKVAAQKKALQEAEENRLKGLTEEQRKTTEALIADLRNKVLPDLEAKKAIMTSSEAGTKYQILQQRIEKELGNLNATLGLGSGTVPSDELIENMKKANARSVPEVELIKQGINEAHVDDLKVKMTQDYNKIVDSYNQYKMVQFNHNTLRDSLLKRLEGVETTFDFAKDEEINSLAQSIAEKSEQLDMLDQEILDEYTQMQQRRDAAEIEVYNGNLQKLQKDVQEEVKEIASLTAEYAKVSEAKVKAAEDSHHAKLREAEVQRKVEENIGHISIKRTGKSMTVTRDIEDIEKSEELTSQDKIPVLDFSIEKFERPQAQKDDGKVVKKGVVIRK